MRTLQKLPRIVFSDLDGTLLPRPSGSPPVSQPLSAGPAFDALVRLLDLGAVVIGVTGSGFASHSKRFFRELPLEARKADELLPYSVFDTTPPRPLIGRYALPQNTGNGDLLHLEGKTWTIRRVTHRKRYRGGRFELYAKIADVTEVSRAAQEEVLSRMLPDSD